MAATRKKPRTAALLGRPSKKTPEMVAQLRAMLETGMPRGQAAVASGLHPSTFHNWMNEDSDFFDMVHVAEATFIASGCARLTKIMNGDDDRNAMAVIKFMFAHRFPTDFSTRQEVRQTGTVEHTGKVEVAVRPIIDPETLATMTPEQIEAAIRAVKG